MYDVLKKAPNLCKQTLLAYFPTVNMWNVSLGHLLLELVFPALHIQQAPKQTADLAAKKIGVHFKFKTLIGNWVPGILELNQSWAAYISLSNFNHVDTAKDKKVGELSLSLQMIKMLIYKGRGYWEILIFI